MTKTKRIILFSTLGTIFVIVLVLGSIFDLQISKAIAIKSETYLINSTFTTFFESFGENVLYLLTAVACAIIVVYSHHAKSNWKFFAQVAFSMLGIFIWFYCCYRTLNHIGKHLSMADAKYLKSTVVILINIFTALTLNTLTIFCFKGVSKETLCKLFKWAIAILIASAISNGIVQGLKLFWGRMRYRTMNVLNDFDGYSPWFIVHGKRFVSEEQSLLGILKDGYTSFPSGHTCAATSSFLLICLPALFKERCSKLWKIICFATPCVYTFLVALSRIMCGAHFLTDVLIAFLITFSVILFVKWLIIDDGYKKFIKKRSSLTKN